MFPACSPSAAWTASPRTRRAACAWRSPCPSIVTPLNRLIGYEAAAKIAKHSVKADLTMRGRDRPGLRGARRGHLEQLDAALDVRSMTGDY